MLSSRSAGARSGLRRPMELRRREMYAHAISLSCVPVCVCVGVCVCVCACMHACSCMCPTCACGFHGCKHARACVYVCVCARSIFKVDVTNAQLSMPAADIIHAISACFRATNESGTRNKLQKQKLQARPKRATPTTDTARPGSS